MSYKGAVCSTSRTYCRTLLVSPAVRPRLGGKTQAGFARSMASISFLRDELAVGGSTFETIETVSRTESRGELPGQSVSAEVCVDISCRYIVIYMIELVVRIVVLRRGPGDHRARGGPAAAATTAVLLLLPASMSTTASTTTASFFGHWCYCCCLCFCCCYCCCHCHDLARPAATCLLRVIVGASLVPTR